MLRDIMEHKSTHIRICLVLLVTCHAGKSAQPNHDSNSNLPTTSEVGIKGNSNSLVTDEFFNEFWREKNKGLCSAGQINQRNNSFCCLPVSCGLGYEVVACSRNSTEDKCKRCAPGYIQVNNVSSLNMLEATCFPENKLHNGCPIDDMKPSRDNFSYNLPLPCQCKYEECYYENSLDNAGTCQRALHICGEGHEMNKTGDCVACQWFAYKDTVGCQPCTQNDTLLRYGRSDGIYIPPESTVPTTTSTEKVTDKTTNLETERIDSSRQEPDNHNQTGIISIAISSVVVFVGIVVGIVLVARRIIGGRARQPSLDTQSPLLTGNLSIPVTPTAGNTPVNGVVVNGVASPLYGQYNQNILLQNESSHINGQLGQGHGQLGQGNGQLGLGHGQLGQGNGQLGQGNGQLGQGHAQFGLSNGIDQNGRTLNNTLPNTDYHHVQLLTSPDDLHTERQLIQDEHPDKHQENPSGSGTVRKPPSSNGIPRIEETAVKNKPPTNYISIRGNRFDNCRIYLPSKRAPRDEVSGSFGFHSSIESEGDPDVGHGTTRSTMIQPGRRDGYLIPAHSERLPVVLPAHSERVDCRPENTQLDPAYLQAAPIQHGERFHEDVAMETLKKPNYPYDTNMEANISETGVSTSGLDRSAAAAGLPHPTRQIAKVAPMRQNDTAILPSVRHISGYPSGGINESDESASSCNGTSISTGYAVGQLPTDIANTSDFSTDTRTYHDDSQCTPGMVTMTSDDTTRLKQTVNDQPPVPLQRTNNVQAVQPVTPLYPRVSDGHNELVHDDNTRRKKVVAVDETDVKHYADWSSPNTDSVMPDSLDSESDLKKMLQCNENDSKCSDTNKECPANHNSENKEISDKFDSEEQLVEQRNVQEISDDNQRDCDSQSTECTSDTSKQETDGDKSVEISDRDKSVEISDGVQSVAISNGDQSVEISGLSLQQETDIEQSVEISDGPRSVEISDGPRSVEINGISLPPETNGNRSELSDRHDTVEESYEIDNTELNNKLPTVSETSDASYEIGGDVDINAIHKDNQHTQEITCRGETTDELNSFQSGYKGF